MTTPRIEHRIRWSGLLIGLGLTIQMLMLLWIHPLSFMIFLLVGCPAGRPRNAHLLVFAGFTRRRRDANSGWRDSSDQRLPICGHSLLRSTCSIEQDSD